MVRYLFYTIGDLTYQSRLVRSAKHHIEQRTLPSTQIITASTEALRL